LAFVQNCSLSGLEFSNPITKGLVARAGPRKNLMSFSDLEIAGGWQAFC
jgi:hypothetical protein